jgi:uncharacterized membrane protein YqjE
MNKLRLSEIALVVGAPALLALVELLHPQPHDLLRLDVDTWLAVHYAQILLFPLAALAVARLLQGNSGLAAAISRMTLFLFGAVWTAWDHWNSRHCCAQFSDAGRMASGDRCDMARSNHGRRYRFRVCRNGSGLLISRHGVRGDRVETRRRLAGAGRAAGAFGVRAQHFQDPCLAGRTADFRGHCACVCLAVVGKNARTTDHDAACPVPAGEEHGSVAQVAFIWLNRKHHVIP